MPVCLWQIRFLAQHVRFSHMEKQQSGRKSLVGAVSSEAQPKRWVAPLQSIKTFSIAEFTEADTKPGDDGSGVFTSS